MWIAFSPGGISNSIIRPDAYVSATSRLATKPGNLKIVYTAMHGVGTETLRKVFKSAGFPEPILVTEQAQPDPDFPTVKFPNPEEPGAIDLSLHKARAEAADLVIANDPDADRCAAAIEDRDGQWRMLRGDEVGALLGEYMARKAQIKKLRLQTQSSPRRYCQRLLNTTAYHLKKP